jgi:hypothetical protein
MGFGDLDVTSIQSIATLTGGSCMEYGCWSSTAATSQAIPTNFTTLIGGILICGNATAHGRAMSICEGPTVDYTVSDSTGGPFFYIQFGW